jgi:hypothetical protein
MKKQALTLIGVLSLLLAAGSAFSQTGEVRAHVPFAFVVNQTTLPAGEYSITTMSGGSEVLLIRGTANKSAKLVNANHRLASKPADRTKIVFRCYGDRYFLSEIWTQGNESGRQLPKGSLESEVALDFPPHDVILVASLR